MLSRAMRGQEGMRDGSEAVEHVYRPHRHGTHRETAYPAALGSSRTCILLGSQKAAVQPTESQRANLKGQKARSEQ